jgi:hypothetical protein
LKLSEPQIINLLIALVLLCTHCLADFDYFKLNLYKEDLSSLQNLQLKLKNGIRRQVQLFIQVVLLLSAMQPWLDRENIQGAWQQSMTFVK